MGIKRNAASELEEQKGEEEEQRIERANKAPKTLCLLQCLMLKYNSN